MTSVTKQTVGTEISVTRGWGEGLGTKAHWRFGDGRSIVYLSGGGDYLTHLAELDTLERGHTYTIPK